MSTTATAGLAERCGPRDVCGMTNLVQHKRLTRATLRDAVRELTARDPGLARIVAAHGPPPLWARPQGFETLVRIILEQQVSLKSAATLNARVALAIGGVTPTTVLSAGIDGLRGHGLTRQKAAYVVALAERVESGELPLRTLAQHDDDAAAALLKSVPGIGPWSASIYQLMALRRPDVWPPGDLALHKAMQRMHGLTRMPSSMEATRIAEQWAPWRAVAARLLWHDYLASRGRS